MKLLPYLLSKTKPDRDAFAVLCGTTLGHITNIAYGMKSCGPELAVNIERESGGAVTRRELRPRDWARIWPEIADRDSAA